MEPDEQLGQDLQNLMERFAKAGWIDRSMVTPNPCEIYYTPLGTQRMVEMVDCMREIEASGSNPTPATVEKIGEIITELSPPSLSFGEMKTLQALVEMFSQTHKRF